MVKKVIAVPRLHEYGEHVNDHQKEIIEKFNKSGCKKGLFFDIMFLVVICKWK